MLANRMFEKIVVLGVAMCFLSITSKAGEMILHPCEDVYINTFGGGVGCNPFLKFDIASLPTGATIDSVFLEVYVWRVDPPWNGNVDFWNVNNQTWTESTPAESLWREFPTSDSLSQSDGFGMAVGWARSIDIKPIFIRDYNVMHVYCSIKMKDPDDITLWAPNLRDSDDTLRLGNDGGGSWYIYFYPHERGGDFMPKLIVYSSEFVVPDIEVSDTLHDFGVVIAGDSTDWTDLWIKNVGDTVLSITGIIPSNPVFSIVSPSFPTTIDSLDSLAVTVRFTPTDTVAYTDSLTIHSNDPGEPQVKVQVLGKGKVSGSDIEVSDTLHDFGVVTIGDSIDWTDLWIKNVGDTTLSITGIIPSNSVFSIVSPSFPTTIDTLDSLAVTVRFEPTNTIVYTDSLTISSNDPDEPEVVVQVSGKGRARTPDIEVSDTLHDFGVVIIGNSTDWTDLWIKNVGDTTLQIFGIIPTNAVFSIVSPTFPTAINSLDSLAVTVRFTPTDTVVYTDSLTIHSNDPDEATVIVQVSGEGWAGGPKIEVSDTLYDFGVVIIGNSTNWSDLWIKNVGDSTLEISGIIPSNAVFSIVSPSFPATINSLDSLAVTVRFTPTDTIVYTDSLTIHSNDPDEPAVIVQVSGEGWAGGPKIWVSDTLYDFGEAIVGNSADWTDLWIKNVGDTTLLILGIIPSNTVFSIVSPSLPTTINSLDSLAVTVRFTPTDTVVYTDSLTIHSNDPDEPAVIVQVSGEGTILWTEENYNTPFELALLQNYPNPFVKLTTISYQLPVKSKVSLRIYDMGGRVIKTIVDGAQKPGFYNIKWDATDSSGKKVSQGVYFYELDAGDFKSTKKLILL